MNDDDWYERDVAAAQAVWAEVQATCVHDPHDVTEWGCGLCWAGDGDPRCQRCGCSVGWPGCQCEEGYLAGPCHDEVEAVT